MTWNSNTTPGDWTTAASGKRNNVFYNNETVSFSLTGGQPSTYKVRDVTGTIVLSGACPTVPGTLTLNGLVNGYFKLYLERGTGDATWGFSQGEAEFCIWRPTAGFPTRPAPGTAGGQDPGGVDLPTRGMMLAGPWRHSVNTVNAGTDLPVAQADLATEVTWYTPYDTTRTKAQILCFPNATSDTVTVTNVVTACGAIWYEGQNEPQGTAAATIAANQQAFYNTVKAANASAKVLGPAVVSIRAIQLDWWDQYFAAGGGTYCDGISFHDYNNMTAGDYLQAKTIYDRFVALLTKYGLQNKPRFITEWGDFSSRYGANSPRSQARKLAVALMLWEQYGIPKEHFFWFYDTSHGFFGYPSWWMQNVGDLTPTCTMLRVWSEELYGRAYTTKIDFGTAENRLYMGNRFAAADGSVTIALIAAGVTDGQAVFTLTGATTVSRVDAMGNTTTLTASSGKVTCPLDTLPCYLRIPNGVTATLVQNNYGRRVDQDGAPGYTITPTGVISSLPHNQYDDSGYDYTVSTLQPAPLAAALNTPGTWTVTYFKQNTFDTVIVHCPPPWQAGQGVPLDFDLQTWDGAAWVTQATVNEPVNLIPWLSRSTSQGGASCFTDSFWSERHVFKFTLAAPVRTNKLRLNIRSASLGGEPPGVDAANSGQGTATPTVTVREVECYYRGLLGS